MARSLIHLAFLLSCGISTIQIKGQSFPVSVEIYQNNKVVGAKNDTIFIKPAPFTLKLKFKKNSGFFLNASFTDYYFNQMPQDIQQQDYHPYTDPFIHPEGFIFAEYENNESNELYIDSKGLHFWMDPNDKNIHSPFNNYVLNKFNSLTYKNEFCIGIRRIDKLFYLKKSWSISSLKFKLKLFFFGIEKFKEDSGSKITWRKKLVIVW